MSERLNAKQHAALEMLVEQEAHGYRNGEGVATISESYLIDGQAWIHFQTARALERRGLIRLDTVNINPDEGAQIWLTDEGYAAARGTG